MKFKLVVLDMDGTLLNSNNEISEVTQKVLREAMEKGINIAIATGRIYTSARGYAELLGIQSPIIACNGGLIRDHISNKVIYSNVVNSKDALRVMEICKAHNVYFHFYDQEKLYVEKNQISYLIDGYWRGRNRSNDKIHIEEIDDAITFLKGNNIEVLKFVLVDHGAEKLINIRKDLELIPTIEVDKSWHNNLEIMNKGVSKGKAIAQLREILGIKKEEVIAFGDNFNDLSMKEYSGAFVAMGNSEDEVKKVATYLTASNDEDGVAKGIRRYVLED